MTKISRMRSAALVLSAALVCDAASAGAFANSDAEFLERVNAVGAEAFKGLKDRVVGPVIGDQTTTVSVGLSSSTVKCSRAGYSEGTLKVLVPALAELTVLNHRNAGEAAPCMAAGSCEAVNPQNILGSGEGVDQIPIRVVLKKAALVDGDVCHVFLVETVTAVIRGVPFYHERRQAVSDRAAADCR